MNKNQSISLILEALSFAAGKHRDQRRKDVDASPYINHPINLANILCNEGDIHDEVAICGALLHDTVEDTETTPDELERLFGRRIRDIVMEVTDDKRLPKDERKRMQIEHAAGLSTEAKLVKLADKISNLRDVSERPPVNWTLQRRQAYFDWAKEVVDRMRGVCDKLERVFDQTYLKRP